MMLSQIAADLIMEEIGVDQIFFSLQTWLKTRWSVYMDAHEILFLEKEKVHNDDKDLIS